MVYMNSFLFLFISFLLFLSPISGRTQVGLNQADPIHPISLFHDHSDTRRYLRLSYCNPYGVSSLSIGSLKYNQPVYNGLLSLESSWAGIPGYYQYGLSIGYILKIGRGVMAGVFLNGLLMPSIQSSPRLLSPGSSFFGVARFSSKVQTCINIDNWTGLCFSKHESYQNPCFSFSINVTTPGDIVLISGLSYPKGSRPMARLGLSILAGPDHTIVGGLQTGPLGFWTGYKFHYNRLDFLLTLRAGSAFGLEPATSIQYLLQ